MGVMVGTSPLEAIRSTVSGAAERVFLSPVHQDGMIVIPAAMVGAGGGAGGGTGEHGKGEGGSGTGSGEGGGFGLKAKPAGAFVIKDGAVSWRPAFDANRVILGGQIVAVVGLLVLRSIVKTRARMHRGRRDRVSARSERHHRPH
jgi:uncharacterized spore protein YtfJ